jgi:hypothetical protein
MHQHIAATNRPVAIVTPTTIAAIALPDILDGLECAGAGMPVEDSEAMVDEELLMLAELGSVDDDDV